MSALKGAKTAFVVIFLLATELANAQLSPSPVPLRADEVMVKTRDGCGIVLLRQTTPDFVVDLYNKTVWGGACVQGFAMGRGTIRSYVMREVQGTAYWGRPSGYFKVGGNPTKADELDDVTFIWNHTIVRVGEFRDTSPRWPDARDPFDAVLKVGRNFEDVDGNQVTVFRNGCHQNSVTSSQDCDQARPYAIFYLTAINKNPPSLKTILCPNPRSPVGCDALWQEQIAPLVARSNAFINEYSPQAEALDKELPRLMVQAQVEERKARVDDPKVVGGVFRP